MTRRFVRFIFGLLIVRRFSRKLINYLANHLGWSFRRRFHGAFGYALRDYRGKWADDVWGVEFLGHTIKIPLRANHLSTDWIIAVTLLGHDIEEKQSYRNLLSSRQRPEVFFDVGGNYGTHSLLFLSQGVDVFYFEPNSSCHEYFRSSCASNGYSPHIEHVALGDQKGTVELRYPKDETWLGTLDRNIQRTIEKSPLEAESVLQTTIDSYFDDIRMKKCVIKIDVEGHELSVLKGAARTIAQIRPIVFFECWVDKEKRELIWAFFSSAGYDIRPHVWIDPAGQPLSRQAFLLDPQQNFWAASSARN